MGNTEDRELPPQDDDDAMQQNEELLDETTKRIVLTEVQKMVKDAVRATEERLEKRLLRIEARLEALDQKQQLPSKREKEERAMNQEIYADLEHFMEALEATDSRTSVSSTDSKEVDQNSKVEVPVTSASCEASSSSPCRPPRVSSRAASLPTSLPLVSSCASFSSPFSRRAVRFRPRAPSLPPVSSEDLAEALLEAAQEERLEDMQALLDAGVDVNSCDENGWSALIWSCGKSHVDAVAMLLGRGADVNAKNTVGWTALHFAAVKDTSGRCASLLLEAGAEVDSRNSNGSTPLHEATSRGNAEAVRVLMAAGADKNTENSEGRTPLNVAMGDLVKWILRR